MKADIHLHTLNAPLVPLSGPWLHDHPVTAKHNKAFIRYIRSNDISRKEIRRLKSLLASRSALLQPRGGQSRLGTLDILLNKSAGYADASDALILMEDRKPAPPQHQVCPAGSTKP